MPIIVNVVVIEATECPRRPILRPVYIYDGTANSTSLPVSTYSCTLKLMKSECLVEVTEVMKIMPVLNDDDELHECCYDVKG
jgi:hypothetical protein